MEESSIFSVFFKISNPLYSQIVKASVEMGQEFGSDFVADGKIHFPHLPLFLFVAPPKNRPKIIRTAQNFVKTIKPCVAKTIALASSESGLIMINFEKSRELYQYHCQALDLFNLLREGHQREKYKDQEYPASLPKKDRDYLAYYGHQWVLDNYTPHITIARINDLAICKKAIKSYRNQFVGKTTQITALCVAEEFFSPVNKSVLIFNKSLVGKLRL